MKKEERKWPRNGTRSITIIRSLRNLKKYPKEVDLAAELVKSVSGKWKMQSQWSQEQEEEAIELRVLQWEQVFQQNSSSQFTKSVAEDPRMAILNQKL